MIRLVKPEKKHKTEALAFRQEFFDKGEMIINGSELFDKTDQYDEWLEFINRNSSPETVAPDWAVSETYFAMDEGERITGIIDLRLELKGILKDAGHCGYSVRPSERRKGYGREMLSQIIQRAGQLGIDTFQLAAGRSNEASVKIIKNVGGKYERSFILEGEEADVFLIDTKKAVKRSVVLYVHGKGGSADEAGHYRALFPNSFVCGLDYRTDAPWETDKEIERAVEYLSEKYGNVILIANSIGAFYSMNSDICHLISRAFFISPMTDLEKLITDMMKWADVSEENLKKEKIIKTDFGEDLSWDYLCYVREHPIKWTVPTDILYGTKDHLVSIETMKSFSTKINAGLTVMEDGEHWFHTEEQMAFLDEWIKKKTNS